MHLDAPPLLLILTIAVGVQSAVHAPASHSLIYYYTQIATDLSGLGFDKFTVLGLLDDRNVSYYDSKSKPEQNRTGEDLNHFIYSLEELQRLRQVNEIVGNCTWPCPDLHVLQRRFGCEVTKHQNGSVHLLRTIEEYGYDGQDFITFDADALLWKAETPKAQTIKTMWDKEKRRTKIIRHYLKNECFQSLSNGLNFSARRKSLSPPDFQTSLFAQKSFGKDTLRLTCLATGFFPKDVNMTLRKFTTSLPEHLQRSSGVRPNEDGTFQLRRSVEIKEGYGEYSCRIYHDNLDTPVTVEWDGKVQGSEGELWGLVCAMGLCLFIILMVVRYVSQRKQNKHDDENRHENVSLAGPDDGNETSENYARPGLRCVPEDHWASSLFE